MVVSFLSGDPKLAGAMFDEIRGLVPNRKHYAVTTAAGPEAPGVVRVEPGSAWHIHRQLRDAFRGLRIGLAPVLFTSDRAPRSLRFAAFLLAPGKILAYNERLERHHLRLRSAIASALFLKGVPLDRIFLRPKWLAPWKRDRSVEPREHRILEGRKFRPECARVAVLSPYFPYPLAHGGAVRISHLLREAARDFDVVLFAFTEGEIADPGPVLEFCSRAVLVEKPRYREPRWSTLRPPEACEYSSAAMRLLWTELCRELGIAVRQVEYTHLAAYGGDVLIEHDVTFDLYRQVYERRGTLAARWDWFRWRRFETAKIRAFRRVVTMSEKDSALLGARDSVVIPNGVDLERFQPEHEIPGRRLFFVGSFRHFPNAVAYRYFIEQIWPLVRERFRDATLTAIAGPDPGLYWRAATGVLEIPRDDSVTVHGFIADVRPFYVEANLVVVPTLESAGTNLKALEAMAMERAMVSTSSGCAGLGLEHGASVWIADDAQAFADGIARLLEDERLRRRIAKAARSLAESRYDWRGIGTRQALLYRELLEPILAIRRAAEPDIAELDRIQRSDPGAVLWEPRSYLQYDCRVAVIDGKVSGFVVSRNVGSGESEVLSLVVDPDVRRRGVGRRLMRELLDGAPGAWFLEVRESNVPARNLYRKLGFQDVALRPSYYQDTGETAVVMRRQSC